MYTIWPQWCIYKLPDREIERNLVLYNPLNTRKIYFSSNNNDATIIMRGYNL